MTTLWPATASRDVLPSHRLWPNCHKPVFSAYPPSFCHCPVTILPKSIQQILPRRLERRPMFFSETVPWDDEQLPSHRPSTGRRMLRAVVCFSFVFLIGVATTLGWQSYHGEAKELVRTWAPWLSWVLARAPATADTSSELGQRLKPVAIDLALVRRSVEQLVADQKQLATKQEEIAHDVAMIQSVERDFRQNISSGPPPGTLQILPHKPAQPPAQSLAVQ